MADFTGESPWGWWEKRRLCYNIGLVCAGVVAFLVYAVLGDIFLSDDPDFEITVFTVLFQGVGYLVMMGLGNVCYLVGPLSEQVVEPANRERYRRICYALGFWFSALLPFSVPALVLVSALLR